MVLLSLNTSNMFDFNFDRVNMLPVLVRYSSSFCRVHEYRA